MRCRASARSLRYDAGNDSSHETRLMSSERCWEITSASSMCPFSVWNFKVSVGICSVFEEGRVRRRCDKEGKGFKSSFTFSFMVSAWELDF
jgi:hypothetical protein